ncbi:MAG TPA: fumarylacetoacetase [Candidatus Thioglobus sp.]|nr:fumarylacetoacetase [Candidatus Thioglobus sp.]HIL21217.1 fumarylacetoacetase [Candidatus Thioglobus sp.]
MQNTNLNSTHDLNRQSWVGSANDHEHFPIQNLPFAVFKRKESKETFRVGVAIGDEIVDLVKLERCKLFNTSIQKSLKVCAQNSLNKFMSMGVDAWSKLRLVLSDGLTKGSPLEKTISSCLIPQSAAEYKLPAQIGDYTDFYTSIHHATNIGKLFRPDNPLLPNYQWLPIGYHGRSSSIDVSGQTFARPTGQTKAPDAAEPSFGPAKRLDYELEVGIFVGKGNEIGERISIDDTDNHIFGLCLLNDWSARDIQAWEYQPLGPFLSKNFATTISPWIVTTEALAPYRTPWHREEGHPQPVSYLESDKNRAQGGFDVELEVLIETQQMRDNNQAPQRLSRSNFKHSYWTVAQMLAHHSVGGCNMQAGDLLGSGTQSGPDISEAGALIELTSGGKNPITLNNGEVRTFLEDGDTIIMKGWCEAVDNQRPRIGFGEVVGTLLSARI